MRISESPDGALYSASSALLDGRKQRASTWPVAPDIWGRVGRMAPDIWMGPDIYYLDIGLKDGDVHRARQIVQSLGKTRDGKCFREIDEGVQYTSIEDPASSAWKFQYVDFEDRAAALKVLAMELDRIDEGWRACLTVS